MNEDAAKPASKQTLVAELATSTGLTPKEILAVLDALTDQIGHALGANGPGVFILPGVFKLTVKERPAKPERQGTNPFTGQPMVIKAKPAHSVVKAIPLKKLKEAVQDEAPPTPDTPANPPG
jgi:nucleoid DNA-binding protein